MTALDALQIIAPELVNLDNTQGALDIAEIQTPTSCVKNRDLAVAYLAAHILTQSKAQGAGAVTSVKEGQLSINYASSAEGGLDSTSFGQEYKRLTQACGISAMTRVKL